MSYCAAPFNSVRVDAESNQQVIYKPCCFYKQSAQYANISEYLNSNELQDLRYQLQNNVELPAPCSSCQRQEDRGQVSLRQHFNSKFGQSNEITQLEIFPSNVCNLKCFMCDGASSTALAAEHKKLNFIKTYKEVDNVDACFDAINALPNLTDVSFIGGEFFLAKKNIELLDLLIEKQISARVVTNGTIILPEHVERLKKINRLELQVSIDGIKESYEFMRYPAKWETVNSNILYLKQELTNAKLNFNFVVQPLNIQYMILTLDYSNRLLIPTRLTNLGGPDWLTWAILTEEEKQIILELLEQQQQQYKLTAQQKAQISSYQNTIKDTVFDQHMRDMFVDKFNKILNNRAISQSTIEQHLGKLGSLLS